MSDVLAFVGFLFPPAIDLINRYVKNSDLRFWVSIVFCIIIGVLVSWITGNLTPNEVFKQASIFIGQAQIAYKLWEKTETRKDLDLTGGSQTK